MFLAPLKKMNRDFFFPLALKLNTLRSVSSVNFLKARKVSYLL